MGEVGEEVESTVVPEEHNEESLVNLEKYSEDVVRMDEAVGAAAIPYQHNKESIGSIHDNKKPTDKGNDEIQKPDKYDLITEETSGDTEDQDEGASSHPKVTKYQDA